MRSAALLSVVAALCIGLVPSTARASGLFVAKFGGEHGHATTDNPTALYYNPAGLALATGSQLLIDATLAHRTASYTRPESAIDDPGGGTPTAATSANAGEANLTNQAASPFLGFRTDLGVENFGLGVGFFVPIGGAAVWDGNSKYKGNEEFPGAQDGITRWWAMEGTMTSMYLALGAGYRLPDLGLSLGIALNGVRTKVHTIRARNTDGSDDLIQTGNDNQISEGRTELEASGTDLALGVGLIYEPAEDVWVGVSFQTRPGITGQQTLKGDLRQALLAAPTNSSKIELVQGMADILRLAYRQRFGGKWEVRAQGEMAFWSAFERQCIMAAHDAVAVAQGALNQSTEGRKCEIGENGRTEPGMIANLERQWEDALGAKLGLSRFVNDDLEVLAGVGYDASAVPDTFMDPALFDLDKYTVSLGALYAISDGLSVSGTFTQVIYLEADTSGKHKPPTMEATSIGPDAGGTYKQAISVLNIGLLAKF